MRILTILSLLLLFSSCWPTRVSLIDGNMPEEWKTFSVKAIENTAPNTPLSYSAILTDKIKEGVQNNTSLQLNPETGSGEIVIEGNITDYSVIPVAMQEDDNSAKNRLTISVQFIIFVSAPEEDKMTLTSTRFVDYSSDIDLATVEASLLDEINTQIIQDVVNKLLSNW